MKKAIIITLCLALIAGLSACGKPQESSAATPSAQMEAALNKRIESLKEEVKGASEDNINGLKSLQFIFVPEKTPQNAEFVDIKTKMFNCQVLYTVPNNAGKTDFVFEWYRTMAAGDIEKNLDVYGSKVKQSKKNKKYYIEKLSKEDTQSTVNVYWSQDGYCFHAVVPRGTSEADILSICKAKKIMLRD